MLVQKKNKSYVRKHIRRQRKAKCWLNRMGCLPPKLDVRTRQHWYKFFEEPNSKYESDMNDFLCGYFDKV